MNKKRSPAVYPQWPDPWVEAYRHLLGALRKAGIWTVALLGFSTLLLAADLSVGVMSAAFIPLILVGAIGGVAVVLPSRRRGIADLRRSTNSETDTASISISYIRFHKIGRVLLVVSTALLLASPSIAVVMSPTREGFWFVVLLLVSIPMTVGAIAMLLYLSGYLFLGRGHGITLTPAGVQNHTDLIRAFYPWNEIEKIAPVQHGAYVIELTGDRQHSQSGEERERGRRWLEKLAPLRTKPNHIPAAYLAINPATAYYALKYYHTHPERRGELGTDAAIERIRANRFDD